MQPPVEWLTSKALPALRSCESGFCLAGKSHARGLVSFIARICTPSPPGGGAWVLPDSYLQHHPLPVSGASPVWRWPENLILTMSVLSLQMVRAPRAGTVPLHFPGSGPKHSRFSVNICSINEGLWLPVPEPCPGSLPSSPTGADTGTWPVQAPLWCSQQRPPN